MTDYCFSTNAGAIGGIPGGRCRSNEIAYRSRLIEHGNLHGLSCHEAFIIDDRKDPCQRIRTARERDRKLRLGRRRRKDAIAERSMSKGSGDCSELLSHETYDV